MALERARETETASAEAANGQDDQEIRVNTYSHILKAIYEMPWAIMPEKLEAIVQLVQMRAQGVEIDFEAMDRPPTMVAMSAPARSGGSVSILPLFGTISQRMNVMSDYSGGTSTEKFTQAFRSAMADSSVKAVVLNVDSPGGTIYGVDELAKEIHGARGDKRIVAVANSLSASAAYWIASAADEFAVTPGGEVGSVGVFAAHFDESKAVEMQGVKTTLISAGKFKTEGNPYEPLSDEARAAMQTRVDDYYGMFVEAVGRNRGVTAGRVKAGFGQGRVVGAEEALKAGMVDRVATLDQTLSRLGVTAPARTAARGMSAQTRIRRLRAMAGYQFQGAEASR
jgi:signal peptide peptidase SppA